MQLKLALQGKLSDVMEKHYSEGAKAVTLGITAATNGLKTSLREQVRSAGMSSRMANTWRGVVYPKGKPSISAAGQVYSNAEKIMQGFEYASIIRGKNGLWLAIPTDAIPKKARGKRMTPGLYEQMKGVRLQFVYRRNACSLLFPCAPLYLPGSPCRTFRRNTAPLSHKHLSPLPPCAHLFPPATFPAPSASLRLPPPCACPAPYPRLPKIGEKAEKILAFFCRYAK